MYRWQPQYGMGDSVSEITVNPCAGGDTACEASYTDSSGASIDSSGTECAFGAAVNGVCPSASAAAIATASNAGNASAASGTLSAWLNKNASTIAIGSGLFVGLLVIGAGKRR